MEKKALIVFWVVFGVLFATMSSIFIYFIINAEDLAITHMEPQFDLAVLQGLLGFIIGIVFARIKYFRNNMQWYLIPILFVIFAFMYDFTIVGCPVCNSLS